MGIVDDGRFLRLGIFEGTNAVTVGLDLNGIGFEYTYETTKWRMIKYSKGSPV